MTGNSSPAAPRVTVVTPAYNVGRYIGEAVDSVLRQTFPDFEYLVVDDGSADDTAQVIKSHGNEDPRLRLIQIAHSGLSAARNAGIREARGRYIALLDGDDRWRPKFLERQVRPHRVAAPRSRHGFLPYPVNAREWNTGQDSLATRRKLRLR